MRAGLKTLTLNTPNLEAMVQFFSCLGFAMTRAMVEKGSQMYSGQVGEVRLRLLSIVQQQRSSTPDLSLCLEVERIEAVVENLRNIRGVQIVLDIEQIEGGRMAIVLDPDGRSIELLETS